MLLMLWGRTRRGEPSSVSSMPVWNAVTAGMRVMGSLQRRLEWLSVVMHNKHGRRAKQPSIETRGLFQRAAD